MRTVQIADITLRQTGGDRALSFKERVEIDRKSVV